MRGMFRLAARVPAVQRRMIDGLYKDREPADDLELPDLPQPVQVG